MTLIAFQEDIICLSCTTTNAADSSSHERVCLAAEGFGNRMCFLQSMAQKVRQVQS
jgi:ryanodine receptor 2